MVITDKDLATKKPIVKKPRTFNPLGAIVFGLSLAFGHSYLYNSFIDKTISAGFSALGIVLLLISILAMLVTLSLSGKYTAFMIKLEGKEKLLIQSVLQIVYFYIGFIPVYGFALVYSISSGSLDFWKVIIFMISVLVLFALAIFYMIRLFNSKEIGLNDLRELFYQPNKFIVILISTVPTLVSTLLILFI